jgi:hypothetical protein
MFHIPHSCHCYPNCTYNVFCLMYITECDRCKGAQLTILSYERCVYLVKVLQKIPCCANNLFVCNPFI